MTENKQRKRHRARLRSKKGPKLNWWEKQWWDKQRWKRVRP